MSEETMYDAVPHSGVERHKIVIDSDMLWRLHGTCDLLRDQLNLAHANATNAGRHAAEMTVQRDELIGECERAVLVYRLLLPEPGEDVIDGQDVIAAELGVLEKTIAKAKGVTT